MGTLPRRQAREMAFQFLFGKTAEDAASVTRSEFDLFCKDFDQVSGDFVWELVNGAGQNMPAIDAMISSLSTNWRIERMPKIDLTILRVAGYEIMFRKDIPKTVSINEAVELAKKFGAEDTPSFVNGILDKFQKAE